MAPRRTSISLATGLVTVALGAGTALALLPGAAVADEFGQHVRLCVQEHGFDGSHNPGMHQGAAGMDMDHMSC